MDGVATRIKHCGITSLDDAHRAAEAGAWALGMIFWAGSPRRCELAEAQLVGASLRRTVQLAGVFVNAPLEEIDATVQACGLSLVQLHGDEGPAFCGEVARRTGAKVIKASRVRSKATLQAAAAFHTDFHLLDAHVAGVPGGTGQTVDWDLVRRHRFSAPIVLSGGLTADNVGAAIAATQPFAVDVASGTERSPGIKDPDKLAAFAAAVRATWPEEDERAALAEEAAVAGRAEAAAASGIRAIRWG
ncbi:MAG: phosphoribosylanthranilate isomerase [Solirubrobacteraceae bacterium]|jgi:phosphoribosylanthranilate isomerase|nr:phosphoribosylanthranilate isomerase [Solirubrobacteraceae bacterium]